MLKLDSLTLFQHVVQLGGITQAADFLSLPKSSVSRKIKELEEHYNVKLINRSARHFTLTEAGEIFHAHSRDVLTHVEVLDQEMSAYGQEMAGKIRLLCVSPMIKCLGQLLREFCRLYPQIELELHAQEVVERTIPKRRFDLLVQLGQPVISNLVAQQIGAMYADYYASPDYLAEFGTPKMPEDLLQHRLIFREMSQDEYKFWWFESPTRKLDLGRANMTVVDSPEMALTLATQGFGVALLPDIQLAQAMKDQQLVPLFNQQHRRRVPINLVYHDRQHIPRRVRLLIDYLSSHFASEAQKHLLM